MNERDLDARVYGCRYQETRTINDLGVLAERIVADLSSPDIEGIPAGAEFSVYVVADVLLQLHVGGLSDDFTFSDRVSHRYSKEADALVEHLEDLLASYDWTNAKDPLDRRFVYGVFLLTESDYHSVFWTPGVVRLF